MKRKLYSKKEKCMKEEINVDDKKRKTNKHAQEKNTQRSIILLIICMILIAAMVVIGFIILQNKPQVKSLSYNGNNKETPYIEVEINDLIINKELWAAASNSNDLPNDDENWQAFENNTCKVNVEEGDKYIFIKDKNKVEQIVKIEDFTSCITKINAQEEKIMLIQNEEYELNITLEGIGSPNEELEIFCENEEVAKIEGRKITGVNDGITNIVIKDKYNNVKKVEVQVTTLITLPEINSSKPFISYKQYTEEEAKILDEYLFYEVAKAGKGTRAGAVAAARFLTLQFKYRIPYFLENGRLRYPDPNLEKLPYCDGEGRYYHEGLYLSESKYASIEKSKAGPMMWGGRIMEYSTTSGMMPNGLDCSGFISWCLLNGGCDFGDLGAGPNQGWPVLVDNGKSQRITMDLLNSHTVKAGDLIGQDGHVGIIIGVTDEHIYVADTYYRVKGAVATEYTYKGLVYNSTFTHIYDMDEGYEAEGNYTAMW